MSDLILSLPELVVLGMACAILLACVSRRGAGLVYRLSQGTLFAALLLTIALGPGNPGLAFHGLFVNDPLATVLNSAILVVSMGAFVYSRDYLAVRPFLSDEYFVLGLFAVLGMMVMVSANNFLTIYLGLELMSLSLYAMVAMHRDSAAASEAAMKYFVLGALSSGMMLYGISILYGVTGSLDLHTVAASLYQHADRSLLLVFGLVFVIAGIAFKLGVVPFHMWIPDVYEGAPTPVTLFLGTAPKLSGFAIAFRLLVEGMEGMVADWQQMLVVLAVLSMAIGNIVAIAQWNIKRMLAYSTIAHMGFLLLGLLAGTKTGYAGSMFYVIAYALMSMGAFGMILLLTRVRFRVGPYRGLQGSGRAQPLVRVRHADAHVQPRGCPALRRLLGQVVRHQGGPGRGFRVDRRPRRGLLHHRGLLLPPDHQAHVLRHPRGDRAAVLWPRDALRHELERPRGLGARREPRGADGPVPFGGGCGTVSL